MKNYKVLIATVMGLLVSSCITLAWSGHDVFTFLVATSIPGFDYQRVVEIRQYTYLEKRAYNEEMYVTEDLILTGKARINIDEDLIRESGIRFLPNQVVQDGKLPVWAIFLVYACFPDNGMDFVEQSEILRSLIGDTQANRHGYLKISFFEYLEGDKSFLHFLKISKEAFKNGDEYWGYRFLAYALHYLEDLMQPYHVRPGTVPELIRFIFDKKTRIFLRNAHSTYDVYMTFLLHSSKYREEFRQMIRDAKPLILPVSDEQLIYEAIMYSYSAFFDIHAEVKKVFGQILYERKATIQDFKRAEEKGELDRLYELTKKLASTLASLAKGVILKTVPSN